MRERIRKPVA